jgi:hypothetical protein
VIADIARDRKSKINHGGTEKDKGSVHGRIGAIEFANHHTGHTEDGLRLSAAPITVLEIR